jgi:hypothetical protein
VSSRLTARTSQNNYRVGNEDAYDLIYAEGEMGKVCAPPHAHAQCARSADGRRAALARQGHAGGVDRRGRARLSRQGLVRPCSCESHAALTGADPARMRRKWGDQDGGVGKTGVIVRDGDGERKSLARAAMR